MTQLMTARYQGQAHAVGHGAARELMVAALRLAGRALERLAERLAQPRAQRVGGAREFEVVELEGRLVGMLYEDGRLVALLPEVGRL